MRSQWLKPHSKWRCYHSAEALRHPKSSATSSFSATCQPPSNPARNSHNLILPVQFQRELELARVVRSGGLTGVGEERTYGRHVVAVGNVEHVGDEIHVEALAEVDALGDAQIVKDCPRSDAGVAAQVAVELRQTREGLSGNEAVDTRLL